jgi:hypothetical protein
MSKITPQEVERITAWVKQTFPNVEVELTGYDEKTGADGLKFEVENMSAEQAIELMELRDELQLPAGMVNTKLLSQVTFHTLFPYPKY